MPRNPLLEAKRVHTVKVCLDDSEMADLCAVAAADDRSPSQLIAHMARLSMYGRMGHRRPQRQRINGAHWAQATLEEVGFTNADFLALAELGRQYNQPPASVLLQLVRMGLFGRVPRPADEADDDFVDSLFGTDSGRGRGRD